MNTLRMLYVATMAPLLTLNLCFATPELKPKVGKKDWNIMVYMANNNNLHRFGVQNFRQMVKIGSSPHMNILLQMDQFGELAISRFFIEKNNPCLLESHANTATSFSGTQANLVEFAHWGISNFESKNQCLVLWNHGAGIKDADVWGRYLAHNRDSLFVFNNNTGLLELDQSLKKSKALSSKTPTKHKLRGIAFNDAAQKYINNQDLKAGLEQICKQHLNDKKIEILSMDACHMAMIEVASQVKTAVNIMVASQEVEPGAGINYVPTLSQFTDKSMDSKAFARHIVQSYRTEYEGTLGDYTQSAVDLSYTTQLEKNLNALAQKLIAALLNNKKDTTSMLLKLRTNQTTTTEFFDADYIDLGHFYKSLMAVAPANIKDSCAEGLIILKSMVIDSVAGRNLPRASGLSIYFPMRSIHKSYYKTEFALSTAWPKFLEAYIGATRVRSANKTAPVAKEAHHDHDHEHGAEARGGKRKPCCTSCASKTKKAGHAVACCGKKA